jgi:DNA-binding response OmpR family regulator
VAKILVIEDEEDFRDAVSRFLQASLHEVDQAQDVASGDAFLKSYEYDLLVLDLNLPDGSGSEICRSVRARGSKMLILVLSGKRDIQNKTQLLDIGADDYLTKPVDLQELRSRVAALLRRKNNFQGDTIVAGGLVVDTQQQKVTLNGELLDLGKREFQLLEFLAKNPNRVLPVELIFQRVWPTETDVSVEVVRTGVKRLRQKVDPSGKLIETVYGTGYIFHHQNS